MVSRQVSPVEVTRHFLGRANRLQPKIHAYITIDAEGALGQANAAEKAILAGDVLGPLHGVPIGIKDLIWTKGLRSTGGSLLYEDFVPDEDEILVERLRKAGAIILGKTNTPEFGAYARSKNRLCEEALNPWDTTRITGASSGGAGAASAAGTPPINIGSDGGGSIRLPAAYNGVFALHPSAGRVPNQRWRDRYHDSCGPMTLDVRDAANVLQVVAGPDPRDSDAMDDTPEDYLAGFDAGVSGVRIAWSRDFGHIPILDTRVVGTVAAAVQRFTDAGAHVDEPGLRMEDLWEAFILTKMQGDHVIRELAALPAEKRALLSPGLKPAVDLAASLRDDGNTAEARPEDDAKIAAALRVREDTQAEFAALFQRYDLICTPTTSMVVPVAPPGFDIPYTHAFYADRFGVPYLYSVNFTGMTAASVPCGFVDGLPVGMHLIAPCGQEALLLRAAQAFSEIQPWHETHPLLAL
jgi:Asp-tRNA(Asn)/Glu-tRNA(Gln) amidotransferase A subunit family amidase